MRAARRSLALLLLLLGGIPGCVVDGTLGAAGGGQLQLRYRLVSVAHFEQMKAQLRSPDVTLTEASMTPEKRAVFGIAVRDVRTLSTAAAFAHTRVALADEPGGLRTLTIAFTGEHVRLPQPYVDYLGRELRLRLTLPGEVVRSNATAVAGRTATWVRPLGELQQEDAPSFTVTYRASASS